MRINYWLYSHSENTFLYQKEKIIPKIASFFHWTFSVKTFICLQIYVPLFNFVCAMVTAKGTPLSKAFECEGKCLSSEIVFDNRILMSNTLKITIQKRFKLKTWAYKFKWDLAIFYFLKISNHTYFIITIYIIFKFFNKFFII